MERWIKVSFVLLFNFVFLGFFEYSALVIPYGKAEKKSENLVIDFSFRVIMATVKAMLVYLIYFLLALMLVSLLRFIPGFLESIGAFIAVYIAFMILSDLTAKTVFQYFFKTPRACYLWRTFFSS